MQEGTGMDRAIAQASDIGRLKEQSEASKQDRRDIWENIRVLSNIASQNNLLLSKMEDLTNGQRALAGALSDHEIKIDGRLTALERRDERSKGALAALLSVASGIGGGIAICLQWALVHFWPSGGK